MSVVLLATAAGNDDTLSIAFSAAAVCCCCDCVFRTTRLMESKRSDNAVKSTDGSALSEVAAAVKLVA